MKVKHLQVINMEGDEVLSITLGTASHMGMWQLADELIEAEGPGHMGLFTYTFDKFDQAVNPYDYSTAEVIDAMRKHAVKQYQQEVVNVRGRGFEAIRAANRMATNYQQQKTTSQNWWVKVRR